MLHSTLFAREKSTEKNTPFSIKIDIREINKVDMDIWDFSTGNKV